MRDPCVFFEEGGDVGGGADTSTTGPYLCSSIVKPCYNVLEWRHAWEEKVEVGDVRHQLQVIDGQKPVGILIGENVDLHGSAEC